MPENPSPAQLLKSCKAIRQSHNTRKRKRVEVDDETEEDDTSALSLRLAEVCLKVAEIFKFQI